jgi:Translationally controlled tumour protein
MIIYKCRFTGDEMLSDAFKPTPVKDDEGNIVEGLIQIQSQKVNKVCFRVSLEQQLR